MDDVREREREREREIQCLFTYSRKGSLDPSDLEIEYGDDLDHLMARLKLIEGDKEVAPIISDFTITYIMYICTLFLLGFLE